MPTRWILATVVAAVACGESAPFSPPPLPPPAPGMPSVSVSPTGRTIAVGDSIQFTAVTNVGAITAFTWAVDHPDIASVDAAGMVRSLKAGAVAVRACGNSQLGVCGSAALTIQ